MTHRVSITVLLSAITASADTFVYVSEASRIGGRDDTAQRGRAWHMPLSK